MSRTLNVAFIAFAICAISMPTFGQIAVWKDDDPVTDGISATSGFLIVNQIEDPTGDPAREIVGDVSTVVSNEFSNMRPSPSAPQPVPADFIGKSFSFTLDYFVPASSSMQNNLAQTFFLSLNFRDEADVTIEQLNAGFVTFDSATLDTWQTIEITGTVPAGSDEVVPLMVFNNGNTPQVGTAMFVDNVDFSIVNLSSESSPIWVDEDPTTMDVSATSGGLIVTQVMDPTGDPDRVLVGEVDHGASTQQFTNMRPEPSAPQMIPPEFVGLPYEFTLDYFVPSDGTMSTNQTQTIFLSLNLRDVNGDTIEQLNNGFINFNNAQLDTWQTLRISGVIPEGIFDAVPLMVLNNQNAFTPGVAFYVDNVDFSVQMLVCDEGCEFELGDVNQDGSVDLLDVSPFVELLTSGGEFVCEADVNEDGNIDLLDVAPLVAILTGG